MTNKKTHFTRKNFIFIDLLFFYLLFLLAAGFIADASNSVIQANSPLKRLFISALHLPEVSVQMSGWLVLGFFAVYAFFFACAFLYEIRLAKFYEKKIFTTKWSLIYAGTFVILSALWIGLSLLANIGQNVGDAFLFFGESLLIGTILFLILGLPIFFLVMLIVNVRNIDKPFRFNKGEDTEDIDDEKKEDESREPGAMPSSDSLVSALGTGGALQALTSGLSGTEGEEGTKEVPLGSKEYVFPALCSIDEEEESRVAKIVPETNYSLAQIVENFRLYLAKNEGLYFSLDTLRAFLSGMAASRLIILEGLSGTGKSSLARYFSEFIGEESFFEAVQASWRDRTSILGFYNDFSRRYSETDFLKRLYRMSYRQNDVNIMVLDEVNISRVEYYFADFLSILEYPVDKWKLRIMQVPYDFEGPSHLEEGVLQIPENTWFIGTANKDDSTYTITDKVYDRAITISFDDRNEPFEVKEDITPIHLSYSHLNDLFAQAISEEKNRLSKAELASFDHLTSFVSETFDITFGNRVLNQIQILVPVYVACGGKKTDALDFLFARKVLYKLEGRYEDFVKQGLQDLESLLDTIYGKDSFPLTHHALAKLIKRL